MRAIRGARSRVPTLAHGGSGGREARRRLARWEADGEPPNEPDFPAHWNDPDVRGALYAIHRKVCAYCGCSLPRNDRGDVEHFRPKGKVVEDPDHSGYWWLAYVIEDYLLSCSRCNRVHKQDRFPLRPRGRRVRYPERVRLSREPRLLLHPRLDPVEEWLRVGWQEELCPIRANEGLAAIARVQVEGTLKFFHINTDPDLVSERITARENLLDALDARQHEVARRMAIRYLPHSLVARQILEDRAPELLPRAQDELDWLLNDLHLSLDRTFQLMMEHGADANLDRRADELLWSFAVLWRDPPAGQPAAIEAFLTDRAILDYVRERRDRLTPLE